MFRFLIKPFRKPTIEALMRQDIEDARLSLMTHESLAEYHAAQAAYQGKRIARLSAAVAGADEGGL